MAEEQPNCLLHLLRLNRKSYIRFLPPSHGQDHLQCETFAATLAALLPVPVMSRYSAPYRSPNFPKR